MHYLINAPHQTKSNLQDITQLPLWQLILQQGQSQITADAILRC